jgi:hypothetical protein
MRILAETLSFTGELSPFLSPSSDPDRTAKIEPLAKAVRPTLGHSIKLRSNGPQRRSARIGMGKSKNATCRAPGQPQFKFDLNCFKLAAYFLIHRKSYTTQIWTNNMSMESLGSVESISAIKSHSFSIQIELIFKLNQIYLLL